MSTYPVSERQGKGTIIAGVALMAMGFVIQVANMQSAASGVQFGTTDTSNIAAVAMLAGLLILAGLIVTILGIIRYAQSGAERMAVAPTIAVQRPAAASTSAAAPAFCSSCGAGIVGEGRFCASCGASTAH